MVKLYYTQIIIQSKAFYVLKHLDGGRPLIDITDLDPLFLCRLLWLSIDKEEHQADDDQRLDQRAKEEDDPHVVAAALPFGLVHRRFCL